MSIDPLSAIIDAQIAAYNAQDIDAFLGFFREDFEFWDFPDTLRFKGRKEAQTRYEALFGANPNLRARVLTRIVRAPLVVDHEHLTGHARRGEGINGVVIYELVDGLIAKVWSGAWSDAGLKLSSE